MKVLMLNGSPRRGGNTARALEEMAKVYYIAKSMGEPQILTEEMTKGLVIG